MSSKVRTMIFWSYIIATKITFLGFIAITGFEVYVRWVLNQNFSVLEANGLLGLAILVAAQMLGLVWLSRSA